MQPYNKQLNKQILPDLTIRALLKDYRLTVKLIAELEEKKANKQTLYLGEYIFRWLYNERRELDDIKAELIKRGKQIEKIKL